MLRADGAPGRHGLDRAVPPRRRAQAGDRRVLVDPDRRAPSRPAAGRGRAGPAGRCRRRRRGGRPRTRASGRTPRAPACRGRGTGPRSRARGRPRAAPPSRRPGPSTRPARCSPSRRNQASTPCSVIQAASSSIVRAPASITASGPVAAEQVEQGPGVVVEAVDEPAVAARRPEAALVALEDDDVDPGLELPEVPGGPEARVAAADDDDVRRGVAERGRARARRGTRGGPGPRRATSSASRCRSWQARVPHRAVAREGNQGRWRARRDSNPRPPAPQAGALSTELRAPTLCVAEREGFEPSEQVTPLGGLANRCTRPLCDLSVAARGDDTSLHVDARTRGGYRRRTDVPHLSLYLPGMTAPGT